MSKFKVGDKIRFLDKIVAANLRGVLCEVLKINVKYYNGATRVQVVVLEGVFKNHLFTPLEDLLVPIESHLPDWF